MNLNCPTAECSVLLSSNCVFYEGEALAYTGISTNDSVQTVIQKLNEFLESLPIGETIWGEIIGTISNQTDLIAFLDSNYYSVTNPNNYITRTGISAGVGISYNSGTGVITNSAPDQTVVLNNGTGISVTGTYPNFTITATDSGLNWTLLSGGALTGNNTISGAFNVGFTNTAIGIGVAPGSITANTKLDIRGIGAGTALGLRYATNGDVPRVTWSDEGNFIFSPSSTGKLTINFNGVDESTQFLVGDTINGFANIINGTTSSNYLKGYANGTTRWNLMASAAGNYSGMLDLIGGVNGFIIRQSSGDNVLVNVLDLRTSSVSNSINPLTNTPRAIIANSTLFDNTTTDNTITSFISRTGTLSNALRTGIQYYGIKQSNAINLTGGTTTVIGYDWSPTITGGTGVGDIGLTHIAFRATLGKILFGGSTITAGSVLLDLQSTSLALLLTRVTNIASVATPVNGMVTYDATTNLFNFRQNGSWVNIGGTTLTGSTDEIIKYSSSTSGIGTKVFSTSDGNLVLGDSGLVGTVRSISTNGSGPTTVSIDIISGSSAFINLKSVATVIQNQAGSSTYGLLTEYGGGVGLKISGSGNTRLTSGDTTGVISGNIYITSGDTSGGDFDSGHIFINSGIPSGSGLEGNLGIFTATGSFGGGEKVIFIANATTIPGSNPTGGGILYVEGGALKFRGSSGTISVLGPA